MAAVDVVPEVLSPRPLSSWSWTGADREVAVGDDADDVGEREML